MYKTAFQFVLLISLIGCSSPGYDSSAKYHKSDASVLLDQAINKLVIALNENIDLRGEYSNNDSIEHPDMLYMDVGGSAGVVGLLAQVMTNAAIASEKRNKKLIDIQNNANTILRDYGESFDGFTNKDLAVQLEGYSILDSSELHKESGELYILSKPVYFISQDKSTLILNNVINIAYGDESQYLYENVIKIIERNATEEGDTDAMKNQMIDMFSRSILLMEKDRSNNLQSVGNQRTYKIKTGEKIRVERGVAVSENTNLFRNLRGWVVSYPD